MSISDLYNLKASTNRHRQRSLLSLPTPTSSTGITSRLCNICYTNRAAYTCPSCNLPYCSLSCFRAETHRECSTKFSIATLKSELVHDEKNADDEERKKVMDILRRLQDPTLPDDDEDDDDDGEEDEDEDGEDKDHERLRHVDLEALDSLPPSKLLELLTPAERRKFELALSDPQKAQQLMNTLEKKTAAATLSSSPSPTPVDGSDPASTYAPMTPTSLIQQRAVQSYEAVGKEDRATKSIWQEAPWWVMSNQAPFVASSDVDDPFDAFAADLRKILSAAPSSTPAAPDLAYNLLAVLLAYVYILRHLNVASLSSLLPPRPTSTESKPSPTASGIKNLAITEVDSASKPPVSPSATDEEEEDDDEMPPLEPDLPTSCDVTSIPRPPAEQHVPDTLTPAPTPADSWPDQSAAVSAYELLDQLVPFLTITPPARDARGKGKGQGKGKDERQVGTDLRRLVFGSAEEASLFVLARLRTEQTGGNAAKLLVTLYRDVQALLQIEQIVTEGEGGGRYRVAASIGGTSSARFAAHQHSLALNAVWDLARFLEVLASAQEQGQRTSTVAAQQKPARGARQKLLFYTARVVLSSPTTFQAQTTQSVGSEVDRLLAEIEGQEAAERYAATARVLSSEHNPAAIVPP